MIAEQLGLKKLWINLKTKLKALNSYVVEWFASTLKKMKSMIK